MAYTTSIVVYTYSSDSDLLVHSLYFILIIKMYVCSELNGGAIAGVVIGAILGAVLIFLLVWFITHQLKKKKHKVSKESVLHHQTHDPFNSACCHDEYFFTCHDRQYFVGRVTKYIYLLSGINNRV